MNYLEGWHTLEMRVQAVNFIQLLLVSYWYELRCFSTKIKVKKNAFSTIESDRMTKGITNLEKSK